MAKVEAPESIKDLPLSVIQQMTQLATSGFGLVAALAWNNVIRETVDVYIKPYIGEGSGIWSLLIYAVLVTSLAVLMTLQLARIEKRLENVSNKGKKKKK